MRFLMVFSFLLITSAILSQPPQLFKYQGLARAADGTPLADSAISIRISIHKDSAAGSVVYRETHNVVTNTFGSFSINIGSGTVNLGNFTTIAWGRNLFFQEVELNNVSMGTSQYLSVPYALAADSARRGIAPFWVQNTSTANDTTAVSVIAISNGGAPTAFLKNNGPGDALMVDGNVQISGTLNVTGTVFNPGFSNFQVFNSSGTFTVPTGITKIMVELWGGGGGGGGGGSSDTTITSGGKGGGGGGGGYVKDILTVSPGASITVTIGNGGNGGSGGFGNSNFVNHYGFYGDDGGSTFFGSTTAGGGFGAAGGNGGTHSGNGSNAPSGGAGGNAPGLLGIVGQFGFGGDYFGYGGSSPNGGFGGNPGGDRTPGGGGSGGVGRYGGVNGDSGTNGGNGRVIVWW